MNTAFLSLGGNLGNRKENLDKAVRDIENICGRIIRKSSLYETDAWGSTTAPPYLNMAVKLQTALTHVELLEKILLIEKKLGRKRTGPRYSDRVIDIDILFYNKLVLDEKHFNIPHPRLHLRKFALIPLKEIDPEFVHPVFNMNIRNLLKICPDKLKVRFYKKATTLEYIAIEGNMGSGKTTLAHSLAKKLNAVYLPETFEQNNLLPLFYNKRKKYAFPLEYSFLISRYEQLFEVFKQKPSLIVSDFSFYRSLWFSKVNLSKKEFAFFKDHFRALASQLPKPNLIIYLRTDIENLRTNIVNRGRPYEQKVKDKYIKALGKQYEKKVASAAERTLVIDVKKYDAEMESSTIKTIQNYIKENFG